MLINKRIGFILGLSFAWVGCSPPQVTNPVTAINGRISPTYQGPSEPSYCGSPLAQSSPVTITGTAEYEARIPFFTGGGGLGAPGAPRPIRYAEIRITNSAGTVVQCGETDASGNFSIPVSQGTNVLTLSVNARANNNKVKISVLDAPERNQLYSLQKEFTPDINKSLNTLTASATGGVLGGAFNIYDQILNANEYLRNEVGTCGITGCPDFTVAEKVFAYWELGFNPGSYFVGVGGLSFYLPGTGRLFILGGINGDYNNQDTDHFDNAIIIHEYGHFLEDKMSVSNSPGGSHSGNSMIDPRLAWSEGFANFFNAAVRTYVYGASEANYVDTKGNIDGSTGLFFNADIESYGSCISSASGCDRPTESGGESTFREFAITRYLYDAIDNTPTEMDANRGGWNAAANNPTLVDGTGTAKDTYIVTVGGIRNLGSGVQTFSAGDYVYYDGAVWTKNAAAAQFDNISGMFPDIWAAMVKSNGFKSSAVGFRDIGLLNYIEHQVIGGTSWTNLRDFHSMVNDVTPTADLRKEFAYYVDNTGGCSMNFSLNPLAEATGHTNSNLFRNNDFFHYKHSGGSITLTLNYTSPSGTEANLDLYLYSSNENLGKIPAEAQPLGQNTNSPNGTPGDVETAGLAGSLSAGDYLINVYAVGGIGSATNYELLVNGVNLCPASIP